MYDNAQRTLSQRPKVPKKSMITLYQNLMRTIMYQLGLKTIFVHPAVFPHTHVPTYHDLSNPAGGWGGGMGRGDVGYLINRHNPQHDESYLSMIPSNLMTQITQLTLGQVQLLMYGTTCTLLIKTKLGTGTQLPVDLRSNYDEAG